MQLVELNIPNIIERVCAVETGAERQLLSPLRPDFKIHNPRYRSGSHLATADTSTDEHGKSKPVNWQGSRR